MKNTPKVEYHLVLKAKHVVPNYSWSHAVTLTEEEFQFHLQELEGKDKFDNYIDTIKPMLEASRNYKLKELGYEN